MALTSIPVHIQDSSPDSGLPITYRIYLAIRRGFHLSRMDGWMFELFIDAQHQ